ncbi:MAG TPA: superoxide dismutase [Caulobacteraceae bacterium]
MFQLPPLSYAYDALAPTMSETTLRTHHARHHAKYIETTNALLAKKGETPGSLEDVVRHAASSRETALFNNAGQAWNHAFFWCCMAPGRPAPTGGLLAAIEKSLGGLEKLKASFLREGAGHFGSGWVWLMADGAALSIITTHDGDSALNHPGVPLLVCDLWEHAYYLDYKNDRAGFLAAWWDNLVDWFFVASQYDAGRGRREPWTFADSCRATADA